MSKLVQHVDQTAIQLARETIEQAGGKLTYRNRDGKQYVTIKSPLLENVHISSKYWSLGTVMTILKEHLPNMQITSGGFGEFTFRINPDITC